LKPVVIYGSETLNTLLFYDAVGHPDFYIAAFSMDQEFIKDEFLLGLPLVSFQQLPNLFPPDKYDVLALFNGYSSMRSRASMYAKAKNSGYTLRNYLSHRSDVAPDLIMGDNNVIMGGSCVGFGGIMGNNNLIRQNVYLGHQFHLGSHNIITAGCNIGGHGQMGDSCYLGLGVTVVDHVKIADENLVGAGSVVIRNTEPYSKNVGNPSRVISYHQEEGVRMKVRDE
jgi:acetyltransferase-like isoleucine patch superfamily enzyme